MSYIENPKTKGSGIVCAIPQTGVCPVGCKDCFFQSGRSYLEPLNEHLPNVPHWLETVDRIVRLNDGNDSNVNRHSVEDAIIDMCHGLTGYSPKHFYNTSIPKLDFPSPVVLTVNPAAMTDKRWHKVDPVPDNLMFVRVRANGWNVWMAREVLDYYATHKVPVVLTFMAYYHEAESIPEAYRKDYTYRTRTLNSYWVITPEAWDRIVREVGPSPWLYTCGKDAHTTGCARCGCCIREYFATRERMRA